MGSGGDNRGGPEWLFLQQNLFKPHFLDTTVVMSSGSIQQGRLSLTHLTPRPHLVTACTFCVRPPSPD
jgi:hypothetical protein